MKKALYMTLTRRWFNQIAQGRKKMEFRRMTPFWEKRLRGRQYDEVHFRNGYEPDSPFMRVEYLGFIEDVHVADPPFGDCDEERIDFGKCFALRLGAVLEINWDGRRTSASTASAFASASNHVSARSARTGRA
jgi:hypothetical protein